MSLEPNEYGWHTAALAGEIRPLMNGLCESGWYRLVRDGKSEPVIVWKDEGQRYGRVGLAAPVVADERFFDQVFTWCCKRPISEELYEAVTYDSAPWPDAPPELPVRWSNAPADPIEVLERDLELERKSAQEWLDTIGGHARTKEEADKAANWADRLATAAKAIEAKREELKRPILEEARKIDGRFGPIRDGYKAIMRSLKDCTVRLQQEQNRRIAEERARLEAERAAALAAGQAAAPVRQQTAAVGTTGRKISLRTVRSAVIEDPQALAAWLLKEDNPNRPELMGLLQTIADRVARSKMPMPPGTRAVETSVAA